MHAPRSAGAADITVYLTEHNSVHLPAVRQILIVNVKAIVVLRTMMMSRSGVVAAVRFMLWERRESRDASNSAVCR